MGMEKLRQFLASDIPFARDDAHRLLPLMLACLVGFAALLLALSISLSRALDAQSAEVAGVLQVEVPHASASTANLGKITELLERTEGVEEVTVLKTAQMEALLKPWLGKEFALDDLPVPVIIDVQTESDGKKTRVDVAKLAGELKRIASGITLADRGPWIGHMVRAVALLQGLVLLVAGLLMACVVGMIVLISRVNLKLHFKAVSLLHMFGATDEYILRQFQWNNAALAGRGALGGVVFSGLVFITWVVLSHRWDSPVLPQVSFAMSHGLLFVLLPIFTALIALVATRLTVQSMLRHMH